MTDALFNKIKIADFLSYCKRHSSEYLAYRHINGFDKVEFKESFEGETLRIHIWHCEQRRYPVYHYHPWDMRSLVIAGELRHTTCGYRLVARSDSNALRSWEITADGVTTPRIREMSRRIQVTSRVVKQIPRGNSYALKSGIMHDAVSTEESTITLCLIGKRLHTTSLCASNEPSFSPKASSVTKLTKREVEHYLEFTLENLR